MAGKRLKTTEIDKVRELLLAGNTAAQAADIMGVSAATINNYKAYFKKHGDKFPDNRGRKPKSVKKAAIAKTANVFSGNSGSDYHYTVNGIKISFSDRPKSLRIGKKGMVVEY
ncbi:MAG: hypothetical protein RLZZ241_345 [Bacteroidota bacterium]|jgi:transposase